MKQIECSNSAIKSLPIVAEADVIVAGAGPAGVCAAIAAARTGAKTVLLENAGCLGGVWTTGALGWIIDPASPNGLLAEIIAELKAQDCVPPTPKRPTTVPFAPEGMKLLLENLCVQANVRIRLHTLVTDVIKADDGTITAVITESKSGREAWCAKVFIDATGDGDLGALSGCNYKMGNKQGRTQPMSLLPIVTGINATAAAPYIMNYADRDQAIELLLKELHAEGVNPSYKNPSLFHIGNELFLFMANHQYDCLGTNADDLTTATIAARQEINEQISALRRRGGIWQNLQLASTASYIGVREGRRIKGLYEVSLADLKTGVRHEDAVCRSTFCIDVHALDAAAGSFEEAPCEVKPYDIPLRALISADVENLMMAGRCISGDFHAHASYRVTGNAAAIGEAAGVCAALAAQAQIAPGAVSNEIFFAKYPAK